MPKKSLGQYQSMSNAPIESHARAVLQQGYNNLAEFEPRAFWGWLRSYLRAVLGRRHPFPPAETLPGRSHYRMPNELSISIAGDWGTGTEEAAMVAQQMMRWPGGEKPDLTLHLGDVYYVGDEYEVRVNCLGGAGTKRHRHECVTWPAGGMGTFALNGNHEMYAKGKGYFKALLPALGMRDAAGNLPGQGVSFFCLENDYWRLLGLDTAYNSIGPPLLALWKDGSCAFHEEQMRWLREIMPPGAPAKPTVLLTHHQYFSGFDRQYPAPAAQLEEFFDAPVLWLWGHEHKLAGYKLFGTGKLQVHGRCLGNGGMPVEPSELRPQTRTAAAHLLFHDGRVNPLYEKDRLGYNGFVRLKLENQDLTLEYCSLVANRPPSDAPYQDEPAVLVREKFVADGAKLSAPETTVLTKEAGFVALVGGP